METTPAEVEAEKLNALGSVFDSIINTQKLRINSKQMEIKILENRLKEEKFELDSLKTSFDLYLEQVKNFRSNLKIFEDKVKEANEMFEEKMEEIEQNIKENKRGKSAVKKADYFG